MATILCVDDDRNLCRILEKALKGAGHRVLTAGDGEQALTLARDEQPDLALLDLSLPRRDGFEVSEEVRKLPGPTGQMPILLMSSFRITPAYEKRAEALGVAGILVKPVPLDHLLEVVGSHLKGEAPPAPKAARSKLVRREAAQRFAGTLEDLSFPYLLHELHGLRATGVLLLSAGRKRKAIQFREGYPVAVKSNLVGECLGNLLVRQGALSKSQLQESLARMKRGEGMQGQILVAMEVLSEEEISRALQEQAVQKLFEVFRWPRGSFKLEVGARVKGGNALAIETSPANLILRGIREHVPGDQIETWIGEHRGNTVAVASSPFYRLQEIDLSPEERALLEAAEAQPALEELTRSGEAAARALYALAVTGLVELQGERVQSARPAPRKKPGRRAARPGARPRAPRAEPAPQATPEAVVAPARAAAIPDSPGDARPEPPAAPARSPESERALRGELATIAERLRKQTYFEMLDVDGEADEAAVRSAYDDVASRMHPDRFHNSSDAVRQLAREVFDLLTKAHDTLVDPRRRTGYLIQLKKGERSAAERRAAESALDAEVAFQKGEAKLRGRDYEGALLCFGEALQQGAGEGEYHAHYGWALYLCHPDEPNMLQEAIEHVRRGVKLARDREKPYLFLGRLYKAVGRAAAAEKMFTRAVQIRPDSVEALRELRLINMRRGKARGWIGRLIRR